MADPDIVVFLRARLDEREALAKATTLVPISGRWIATRDKHAADDAPLALVQGRDKWATDPTFDGDYVSGSEVIAYSAEWQNEAEANLRHIADNDPAFVLADVAAKRQIIGEHQLTYPGDGEPIYGTHWEAVNGREYLVENDEPDVPNWCASCCVVGPCRTLRLLALPYAGHPEFREEWKL